MTDSPFYPKEFSIVEISEIDDCLGDYVLACVGSRDIIAYPIFYLDYVDDHTKTFGLIMQSPLFSGPVFVNTSAPALFSKSQITACYGTVPFETESAMRALNNYENLLKKVA